MALSCGRSFTLCVTEDAELFAWGCGMGSDPVLHEQQPAPVGGPASISRAAAGARHHAVVAEDGALYTCGEGRSGPLGLGDGEPRRRLTRVPQAAFGGVRVVLASCGGCHTIAVTGAAQAWACGENDSGQLGVGDTTHRLSFTQVAAGGIVAAACGWNHSVLVSADGSVRTCGWGVFGCLGHNDRQGRVLPTLLCAEPFRASRVASVAAGDCHTLAVDDDGALWAWGNGAHGQLCLGDQQNRLLPTLAEAFGGSRVRAAACGDAYTLVLTEAGELWAAGRGARGRLGLADEDDRLVPARVDPRHFAHAPLCAVAAGECHSAAVTEGGELYTWGRGEALGLPSQAPGGLGHADLADRLVPTRVPPQLLGGAGVGRTLVLPAELALAFAMGTHARLGGEWIAALPAELVRRVLEACARRVVCAS